MKRRLLVAALFLGFGCVVWLLARDQLSLELLAAREQQLRATIEASPVRAYAVGFVIYVLVSMFPGTSGKSIVCGWLFGFWQALLMVTGALTIAALGGFSVSRYVLRDALRNRFSDALAEVERALERDGSFYLLTVRMLHVPFTLVNYLCGAGGVPTSTFAWTTALGLVPSTMIFVGVGAGLPTLDELSRTGPRGVFDLPLVVALVLMGAAPWLLRRMARWVRSRWRSRVGSRSERTPSESAVEACSMHADRGAS